MSTLAPHLQQPFRSLRRTHPRIRRAAPARRHPARLAELVGIIDPVEGRGAEPNTSPSELALRSLTGYQDFHR